MRSELVSTPSEEAGRNETYGHNIGLDGDEHDGRPTRNQELVKDDSDSSAAAGSGRPSSSRSRRRRNFILATLALLVAAAVAAPGWSYISSYEDTDDAQVDGHIVRVSSRIEGTIEQVYVTDTQPVRKGQVLVDIEPSDYVVAVEAARARLAQTKAQVESAKADYQTALNKVSQDEATRAKAEYDVPRLETLAAEGAGRREDYQESLRIAKVARGPSMQIARALQQRLQTSPRAKRQLRKPGRASTGPYSTMATPKSQHR